MRCDEKLTELFAGKALIVPKRTKNGVQDQDIIPMIKSFSAGKWDDNTILLDCLVCCQNPTLNPMQIVAAIGLHLPEIKPDFAKCRRIEIYDSNENVFR